MSMKQRVYIDTSVVGGCFDQEFAEDSKALFDRFRAKEMLAIVSETMLRELADAPPEVQKALRQLPEDSVEIVPETQEAIDLAECYLNAGAVTRKFALDALHIAIATVARVHVLVSWNFKHIVNLQRIRAFNSVNVREGYPPLEIRSPKEVIDAED